MLRLTPQRRCRYYTLTKLGRRESNNIARSLDKMGFFCGFAELFFSLERSSIIIALNDRDGAIGCSCCDHLMVTNGHNMNIRHKPFERSGLRLALPRNSMRKRLCRWSQLDHHSPEWSTPPGLPQYLNPHHQQRLAVFPHRK
jgi:hypothetical protein